MREDELGTSRLEPGRLDRQRAQARRQLRRRYRQLGPASARLGVGTHESRERLRHRLSVEPNRCELQGLPVPEPSVCASDETLVRMATNAVLPAEREALREHLDDCEVCGAALLALIRASAPAASSSSTDMPEGTRIGRFTVGEVLGSGNMGTVFTAWDPQLDRTVAIKVLRAGRDDASHAARLLREAKAMAQVRHPNVVTVYEVGQDQDVIFVAMEQVRGPTLRTMLAADVPVAVRLDWLAQIGRALAAVHAAGLIHRDLKPDNVFLEERGHADAGTSTHRVVVGDFGLAAAAARDVLGDAPAGLATGTRSAGTPAYMSPEQLLGEPLDARADVFAFGVTACEVLTGARPFDGRTAAALMDAIERGPARSPALDALPADLRAVLVRCVHADRQHRPASIAEVTRVLEAAAHPSRRRRRSVLVVGGLALGVAVAIAAVRAREDRAAPVAADRACDPDARPRWHEARAPWLNRAGTLSPFVRGAIVTAMDRRAVAWSRDETAACHRDVLVQQAWRRCRSKLEELERRVLEVAVERAWPDDQALVQTLERLAWPASCLTSEAGEEAVALSALPSDVARTRVLDGFGWIARAEALDDLGATTAADEALSTATQIASTIAPSPLDGELALSRVVIQPPSSPPAQVAALKDAAGAAERSGRASLIARSWLTLAERAAQLEIEDATIDAALTQADWAVTRLGDPPRLRARWLAAAGARAWTRHDHETAKTRFRAATALAGDDPYLARLGHLAIAKLAALSGDDRQAVAVYETMLADAELMRQAGEEARISLEAALAESRYRLGELPDAQRVIEAAIERARTALAPEHPQQIMNQMIAASIVLDRGEGARALALLDAATAQARTSLGPDHALVANGRMRSAQVLIDAQRLDDGVAAAREAVRIFDLRQGRRSEGSIASRWLIGEAYRLSGTLAASAEMFTEVLADAEALYGTAHPMWAQLTHGQVDLLISLGRTSEARALLERAIPHLGQTSPVIHGNAMFTLATLVVSDDRARAIELATAAEVALRADPAWSRDHEKVTAWLRREVRRTPGTTPSPRHHE